MWYMGNMFVPGIPSDVEWFDPILNMVVCDAE